MIRVAGILLFFVVSFLGAQERNRVFSIMCYLGETIDQEYWVIGEAHNYSTTLKFSLRNGSGSPIEVSRILVDGQAEAISTFSSMLVIYTSRPGENTYIIRVRDGKPTVTWHCLSRFAAEVGPDWAMCFQGTAETGHTLIPKEAVVYQFDSSGSSRKKSTVPYSKRYAELAREHE